MSISFPNLRTRQRPWHGRACTAARRNAPITFPERNNRSLRQPASRPRTSTNALYCHIPDKADPCK
ncbi:hypothetical protein [Novacetimonas hansenii]|uniref:hypothetical protein n=1 Tax=Novacetimonas hansenii TaxID=436 RepID=UPI00117BD747|nr:hypothetical protein [Novacetimonas hansenii]